MTVGTEEISGAIERGVRRGRGSRKRELRVGLFGVALVVFAAVLSRFWVPSGLTGLSTVDMSQAFLPPLSDGHILGTDHFGRDVLSRVMRGAGNTLTTVSLGTSVAMVVGVPLGLWAGLVGGMWEQIIVRTVDVLYAIPAVLLALALASKFGSSITVVIATLGLWFVPLVSRVARSAALAQSKNGFVVAARSYGRGNLYIALRHILPNAIGVLLVQAALVLALSILVTASLSFLGIGVQLPEPTWGRMLKESQEHLGGAPWLALGPGVAIALSVLSFNLVAQGIRSRIGD